jgi:hypothetical protein
MRDSFLDDRNFPLIFMGILLGVPVVAGVGIACTQPSTPEERAEATQRYVDDVVHSSVTFVPRDGVECIVIRGYSSSNPRMMSCYQIPGPVVTNP